MLIKEALNIFYTENGINIEGNGYDSDVLYINLYGYAIKIRNPKFRKEHMYIHDVNHLVTESDITSLGEVKVATWELVVGNGKYFSGWIMSLWTMGWGLLYYPNIVLKGFNIGVRSQSIISLEMDKEKLLNSSLSEVKRKIIKNKPSVFIYVIKTLKFIFLCFFSFVVYLFPIPIVFFINKFQQEKNGKN